MEAEIVPSAPPPTPKHQQFTHFGVVREVVIAEHFPQMSAKFPQTFRRISKPFPDANVFSAKFLRTLTLQSLLFSFSDFPCFFFFFVCLLSFPRILGVPRRQKPLLFSGLPLLFSKSRACHNPEPCSEVWWWNLRWSFGGQCFWRFSTAKEARKSPSKLRRKFATNFAENFANFTLESAGA